jgi:hypothetical protein
VQAHDFLPFLAAPSSIVSGSTDSLIIALSSCVNQTIGSSTTFGGAACGITWTGGNLSITGTGFVSGSDTAVLVNNSTVGTLTNSGVIDSSNIGTCNTIGTIAAISNSGLVSGNGNGIVNNGGSIGTLTNSGTISGGSGGIYNNGGSSSIGVITNSGMISSNGFGIFNDGGGIGTINSVGTINGNNLGIFNVGGSIGTITNKGTISGGSGGIVASRLGGQASTRFVTGWEELTPQLKVEWVHGWDNAAIVTPATHAGGKLRHRHALRRPETALSSPAPPPCSRPAGSPCRVRRRPPRRLHEPRGTVKGGLGGSEKSVGGNRPRSFSDTAN